VFQTVNAFSVCVVISEAGLSHVVALHSDNSFEIYVDQNLVNSGSLLQDMRSSSVLFVSMRTFMIFAV